MTSTQVFFYVLHCAEDSAEAGRVAAYYERIGLRIVAGRNGVDQALARSQGVIVLVSEAAKRAANVREGLTLASELGKPIFPIRLSVVTGGDLPALPPEAEWTDAFGPDAQRKIAGLGETLETIAREIDAPISPFASSPSAFEQPAAPPFEAQTQPPQLAASPPGIAPQPPPPQIPSYSGAHHFDQLPYGAPAYEPPTRSRGWLWLAGGIVGTFAVLIAGFLIIDPLDWRGRNSPSFEELRARAEAREGGRAPTALDSRPRGGTQSVPPMTASFLTGRWGPNGCSGPTVEFRPDGTAYSSTLGAQSYTVRGDLVSMTRGTVTVEQQWMPTGPNSAQMLERGQRYEVTRC